MAAKRKKYPGAYEFLDRYYGTEVSDGDYPSVNKFLERYYANNNRSTVTPTPEPSKTITPTQREQETQPFNAHTYSVLLSDSPLYARFQEDLSLALHKIFLKKSRLKNYQ